jgi:hypothetical protein
MNSRRIERVTLTRVLFGMVTARIPNRCAAALKCAVTFQKCAAKFVIELYF